jgi:hypothetical protein
MENGMSEVIEFPTPRERAGVSMREDMDMLLDALMGSMIALKNSENVSEEDREADMQPIMELFLKYIELSGQRYPIEDLELDDE